MKKILIPTILALSLSQFSCGSGDEPAFGTGSDGDTEESVTGIISHRNFFVSFAKSTIDYYDPAEGVFTEQSTNIIVTAADRNGGVVANAPVQIRVNWGLLSSNSCVTDSTGECSVTFTTANESNVPIDYRYPVTTIPSTASEPTTYFAENFAVTVVAYTTGEESFTDTNSNGLFDTGEPFVDLDEPYFERGASDETWDIADLDNVDINNGTFDDGAGAAIDATQVLPANTTPYLTNGHVDDTGNIDRIINGTGWPADTVGHDVRDGQYSGSSCVADNCSANTSIIIWDYSYIDLTKDP